MSSPRDRLRARCWRRRATVASLLALALGATLLTAAPAAGSHSGAWHTVERVSVSSAGAEGDASSESRQWSSISAGGRFVAFVSYASNLVEGDTNGTWDVFVRDRQLGTTERASISSASAEANSRSGWPSINADGRFVTFHSYASNLVEDDTNGNYDIFVRDRQLGTMERISVSSAGSEGNSESYAPSVSADGRFVAFYSYASNLVEGDINGRTDVFVRDRQLGTTERASVSSAGAEGNSGSELPSINADGRFVTFHSYASNLVEDDTNGTFDVFVWDRPLGTMERISVSSAGSEGNGESYAPSVSADGRFVAFYSYASNLVAGDTNGNYDIFVRDRQLGTTERASVSSAGAEANSRSELPSINADGRFVTFPSLASNLVEDDTNGTFDVFVWDRQLGITERASLSSSGAEARGLSYRASISADGRTVAFNSNASDLVAGDTNRDWDVFVASRTEATNQPPSVTAASSRSLLYTYRTWTLQVATFTDDSPEDMPHTATIDWGDGSVPSGGAVDENQGTTLGAVAGTVTGSHRYMTPGTYTVTVTVRDAAGDEGAASFQVVVRPHPRLRQ